MRKTSRKITAFIGINSLALIVGVSAFSASAQQIIPSETTTTSQVDAGNNSSGKTTTTVAKPAAQTSGSSAYSWTGGYIGANVGYGWGDADTSFNPQPSAASFSAMAPTTLDVRPKGVIGGVQGGYNYQMGHFVLGGEADIKFSGMKDTVTRTPIIQNNGTPFAGAGFQASTQEIKWVGTVRPRAGAAFGRFLVYGTAGLAYGKIENSANTEFRPVGTVNYAASNDSTRTGWVGGGGVEIGVTKNFSIKSEYLYHDLGKTRSLADATPALPPFQVQYEWNSKFSTWTTGVNFRF